MRRALLAAALVLAQGAASARAPAGLTVERVVMLMRHGVRPPTKDPALPAGMAAEPWPRWDVPPGWLTKHGAKAIRLLGVADRSLLAQQGVLPITSCPAPGTVSVSSDSDERTIATADAYLAGLAPDCGIANRHQPQDTPDPLFHENRKGLDPQAANRAADAALGSGGIDAAQRRESGALADVDRILCGRATRGCGLPSSSALVPARPGKPPKLGGALDRGSTAAQTLLLEYADGKPMREVGWGRASAADIERIGSLHSTEFEILARPPRLAAANASGIAKLIAGALGDGSPKLTVIIGHDTNVANLAGLLGVHWTVPGFAADDPAPGGALGFERVRDSAGRAFVRLFYRAQSLEEIRTLAAGDVRRALAIPGCGGKTLCPLDVFTSLLRPPL